MRTSGWIERVAVALVVCVGFVLIWAGDAESQDLKYKLRNRVSAGQKPAVVLAPGEPLKSVVLHLERQDGKKQVVKKRNIPAGRETLLPFPQPEGSYSYTAVLKFVAKGGTAGEARFTFEAVVATPVKVSLLKSKCSLDGRYVTLQANAGVSHAEIEVFGAGGSLIDSGRQDLAGIRAGGDLRLTWTGGGAVEKIKIKVFDPAGYWTGVDLVPFTVDIPHEEVVFDTGKSSFQPSEARKLDATYTLIVEEIEKHGRDLEINLYIAGYTDTVGSAGGNVTLSRGRARSIASYFRKKGLRIPIFYQGFGEAVLAVQTKDNVDEARNRRALYVLGNQSPPISGQIPRGDWQRLR